MSKKKKIRVQCKICLKKYIRNADNIKKWNGQCKECSIKMMKKVHHVHDYVR